VTYAGVGVARGDWGADVGLGAARRGLTTNRKLALARVYAIMSQLSLEAIQLPLMFIIMNVTTMTIGNAP
jgi:hypothetical protein